MNICGQEMFETYSHIHTSTQTHTLSYWQGQSEWSVSRSPKAQGSYRLQLRCVCALTTPQCVAGLVWKWQQWEWFCHPSLKRKVRRATLVIHQDIDSSDGIQEKGERWKCNKKRHQNYLLANLYNDEEDGNLNEHLYDKASPHSFVSYYYTSLTCGFKHKMYPCPWNSELRKKFQIN